MAIDEFDLSGDTSGTYSVNNDQVTDSFSLAQPSAYGTDAGLSPGAISSIGSGSNPSEDFSDFATQSRSNIAGSDNYSPTFAALDKISRGLDPRGIAGFNNTSFAKTNVGGDMVTAPNPLQQLDQTQVSRITDALKLSGASDTYKYVSQLKGDDLKNYASGLSLKNLSLNDLDNMDTQSMANVFSSLGMTDKNPYGISAQGTSTGVLGGISSLLGLDKTPDFSRKGTPTYMSPKDIAEKARAGFGFASSGRNPSEFGSLGGIANQFGRDVSAGAKQIQNDLIQLADGAMSYLSNKGKAGDTVENIVADQKRIEIADLEKNRLESLVTSPIDRVKITELDPSFMEVDKRTAMDSGASLASGTSVPVIERPFVNLPPDPVLVNQIQRDIAKSRGIFDLPEAKPFSEIINNTEIDAGENKGQNLYDGSQYNDLAMQKLKNLGYNVEVPNLPNAFNSPTKRPFPGTDEVALRRGVDGYTFANTFNRPLDASREGDPSGSNLTTDQLRAAEFSGFSFDPVTNKSIYDERGPIEFIKKTNFPLDQQGIISLNTDMDYGQTNSLDNLLRNTPRSVAERNFLLNEIRKEKERMDNAPRLYPDSGTAGLPGLY